MPNLPIPIEIFDQHIGLLGKTRSGKSSTARVLVEHLLSNQNGAPVPVCVVDPKGDWWGIKLAADGKGPGFPVVIFGGEHADVPLNEHAGEAVAELFATGNRSMLIDLGGWMPGERTRFWVAFASTLFRLVKGRRFLVVDEVHNFAPKGRTFDIESGKALHWANRLASEGLGRGINLIVASQRPQKVHNDLLSSLETLLMKRVTLPADRDAIAEWIDSAGDKKVGAGVLATLAELGREEAWAWSPEIGFGPQRVKFPLFRTYDSFRPQTVEDAAALEGWATVDLADVREKLATVMEEAAANDPEKLRARIADLQDQLRDLNAMASEDADVLARRDEADAAGYARGRAESKEAIDNLTDALDTEKLRNAELFGKLHEIGKIVGAEITPPIEVVPMFTVPAGQPAPANPHTFPDHIDRHGSGHYVTKPTAPPQVRRAAPRVPRETSGNGSLPEGERKVLTAIAQHQKTGAVREQLSVLTGYKRSSRDAYLHRLTGRGLIYADGDRIFATADGVHALGAGFKPLPTGRALRDHWLANLPEGEAAVLRVAIERYPGMVQVEAVDLATGYKRSSRDAYIQRLVARRLVERGRGTIKAARELF